MPPIIFFKEVFMTENMFALMLKDGSDIIEGLQNLAKEQDIGYGFLVSACGKIKEFELVSNGPRGSIEKMSAKEEFQVNAISGKIQKSNAGNFTTLIRVSITKTGFTPQGGQLIKGKASGTLEIGVRKVDLKKMIVA